MGLAYRVLDACGSLAKETWKGNYPENGAVVNDLLLEVHPTVVGDFRQLPFADDSFDTIFFDPPHLIRNDVKNWNPMYLRYGNWKNRKEWIGALEKANLEFSRVLVPGGTLWTKTIDGKDYRVTKRQDLEAFTNFILIEEHEAPVKIPWSTNTTIYRKYTRCQ